MSNKYCFLWDVNGQLKPIYEIVPVSHSAKSYNSKERGGGTVATKKLTARAKETLASDDIHLTITEFEGYTTALRIKVVVGGETDKEIKAKSSANRAGKLLSLINTKEIDFELKPIVPKPKQVKQHHDHEIIEIKDDESNELAELSTAIEGEVVEEIPQELKKLGGSFELTARAKVHLVKHIKTVVKDAKKMTLEQIGVIALDMFERRVQPQKDVYYWLDWRGELQSCENVYYLKRWLSRVDKHMGGNGNIEIDHRKMTEKERVQHGLNDNQIGAVALIEGGVHRKQKFDVIKQRAELMGVYKDIGLDAKDILKLVDRELPRLQKIGIEGYGIVEKTYTVKGTVKETTPPNGWTLYQLAVKRAVKNAAKMWSTPNAQEAWELGESRLTNEQFSKVLESHADTVLKASDGEEIEKFTRHYLPTDTKEMSDKERSDLLWGDDETID
jgi:hypothetical protein